MIQFEGHTATVCSLAFSPDSMTLASGAKDGGVKLWDAAGGLVREYNDARRCPRPALVWSPDGTRLWFSEMACLHTVAPGSAPYADLPQPIMSSPITSLSLVSKTLLAVGLGEHRVNTAGRLTLLDTANKCVAKAVPPPIAGSQRVLKITAHPPTKWVHWVAGAVGTHACIWRSWCITSPNATDVKLNKPAADICVSPDGGTVAIASDWLVRVFTADGKPKTELSGHKGQVACVGFIHGGRTVVSASWDETVRFWDVATGQETARFALKVGKLTALSVSPDETRIAVGGTDGPIVVLDAE